MAAFLAEALRSLQRFNKFELTQILENKNEHEPYQNCQVQKMRNYLKKYLYSYCHNHQLAKKEINPYG